MSWPSIRMSHHDDLDLDFLDSFSHLKLVAGGDPQAWSSGSSISSCKSERKKLSAPSITKSEYERGRNV